MRASSPLVLLLAALILPSVLAAEVYRWVDDQGNVHFGDRPPADRASDPVDIREPMRGVPFEGAREALERPVRGEETDAEVSPYRNLAIVRPEDGTGVRANDGNVTAEVDLDPALDTEAGHRIAWVLDGEVVGEGTAAQTTFEGLDRGAYSLEAHVLGPDGEVLITAPGVEFNVLRFAIPRSEQQRQRPQQFPQTPQGGN